MFKVNNKDTRKTPVASSSKQDMFIKNFNANVNKNVFTSFFI